MGQHHREVRQSFELTNSKTLVEILKDVGRIKSNRPETFGNILNFLKVLYGGE